MDIVVGTLDMTFSSKREPDNRDKYLHQMH